MCSGGSRGSGLFKCGIAAQGQLACGADAGWCTGLSSIFTVPWLCEDGVAELPAPDRPYGLPGVADGQVLSVPVHGGCSGLAGQSLAELGSLLGLHMVGRQGAVAVEQLCSCRAAGYIAGGLGAVLGMGVA